MKIKLSKVRLSFPDLWEPAQFEGKGPSYYRAQFLISKNSENFKIVNNEILKVAEDKWPKKGKAVVESLQGNSQKFCFTDGDIKDYDGYQGCWALSTTRPSDKGRPVVLDTDKSPLVNSDGKPYAGCFVNALVEIWAQDNKFGKGIRATLLGVQFNSHGDAFAAGSVATDDDFEPLDSGVESLV